VDSSLIRQKKNTAPLSGAADRGRAGWLRTEKTGGGVNKKKKRRSPPSGRVSPNIEEREHVLLRKKKNVLPKPPRNQPFLEKNTKEAASAMEDQPTGL